MAWRRPSRCAPWAERSPAARSRCCGAAATGRRSRKPTSASRSCGGSTPARPGRTGEPARRGGRRMSNTLFTNVRIIDGTGAPPYAGEVLVQGNRISRVTRGGRPVPVAGVTVIDAAGATLMPGMTEAHVHLAWNNAATLDAIQLMPLEEHMLLTAANARLYLDSGWTSAVGAATAKPRLDVVIRNSINEGLVPGPRYLAASPEITVAGSLGDDTLPHLPYEEVTMAVRETKLRGKRNTVHARSQESIQQALRHGCEVLYHVSYTDEQTLDMLEAQKDRIFVVPTFSVLVKLAYDGAPYGATRGSVMLRNMQEELEACSASMRALHKRGLRILPGGDYGFAWAIHGENATDLQYLVKYAGMTPMEAIVAATRLGGEIMMQADELGQIREGFLADLLLVDGDPLANLAILLDRSKLLGIMKDGAFHKEPELRSSRTRWSLPAA